MTAIIRSMPSDETHRQRYARELAEYTHRQWDMARRALERANSPPKEQPLNPQTPHSKDDTKSRRSPHSGPNISVSNSPSLKRKELTVS